MNDHKPGPELDALIAEKVMATRYKVGSFVPLNTTVESVYGEYMGGFVEGGNIPPYSTDMSAAWEVVEKLSTHPLHFTVCIEKSCNQKKFTVWFVPPHTETGKRLLIVDEMDKAEKIRDEAMSVAHAICLAALKAVTNP